MVMETAYIKKQKQKMKTELLMLKIKEKFMGKLSEVEMKRYKELVIKLNVRY